MSFAVLLSARPIAAIGRIWADGKLLRGVAGDFKTKTDFRLHTGDESQAADALIASAEGDRAPAHRGCAYAVFEHFQLADYGNHIPSLTFEIVADAATPTLGFIAEDIAGGLVDGGAVTMPVPGFSAYGDSVRWVLETLATAGGAWFAPVGGRLEMRDDGAPDRALDDQGMAADGRGSRRTRTIAAIETVPVTITIGHYDPSRDYQTGLQRARRPGAGTRHDRIEMPASLSAGGAKAIAEAALARAEQGRMRRTVSLGWSAIDLVPGDGVTIAGDPARWRVAGWSLEAMVLTLDLVRLGARDAPAFRPTSSPASSGRVLASPDLEHGPTTLHVFELPPTGDGVRDAPQLMIAAAGVKPGWRRAALLYSIDDGDRWIAAGATAAPAVIGVLATALPAGSVGLRDLTNSVEVMLLNDAMVLGNAADALIDGGANLALIGGELVQFGRAEQVGVARWRLSRLLRGRYGTEAARGDHAIGDRFVPITADSLATIDLPLSAIGLRVRVMASGIADDAGPVEATAILSGASVLPPSPVRLRIDDPGGAPTLRWVRRIRAGWRWLNGGDAPLAEERELYRVLLSPPDAAPTVVETTEPVLVPAAPLRVHGNAISVRQLGTNGQSPPVTITIA